MRSPLPPRSASPRRRHRAGRSGSRCRSTSRAAAAPVARGRPRALETRALPTALRFLRTPYGLSRPPPPSAPTLSPLSRLERLTETYAEHHRIRRRQGFIYARPERTELFRRYVGGPGRRVL